jgi:hypothetical protein
MRPLGCFAYDPGDLATDYERHRGFHLVEATGHQYVGEGDSGGVDVDHHTTRQWPRFRDIDDLDRFRSLEFADLSCAHMPTSLFADRRL